MELTKRLVLILFGLSILATLLSLMYAPRTIVLLQSLLVILFIALVFLGTISGFRTMPMLTWLLFAILFLALGVNQAYLLISVGRQIFPLAMATLIMSGTGCLISIFAMPFVRTAARPAKQEPDEGLLIEGIHPKKKAFVASLNGHTYHDPECRLAKRIKEDKMVYFVNKGEAEEKKYEPCKECIE
jgi:hypothetical protein